MKRLLAALVLSCSCTVASAKTLTAICYHRFGVETAKDPYKISLERLGGQLDWLKAQGYASVSLSQVAQGPAALPEKGVLLSVDDGYKAGALGAAEFEKRGFLGVFFVNPGTLGKGSFMDWAACRELEKRGHDVASHTLTHANLAKPEKGQSPVQYGASVRKELREARSRLEKELGHKVTALAYPYGAYNPAVTKAALAAGYTHHFSVSDGSNDSASWDPLRLRRIILMGHPSEAAFERRVLMQAVPVPFTAMLDGALFLKSAPGLKLEQAGVDLSVDGKPVTELPGGQGPGFHFLTLRQGSTQTKLLFQIAPDAWAPYFAAIPEN